MFNGQEIITLEDSFDSLGLLLLLLIIMPPSMLTFRKFTVTKLEDADLILQATLTEEILAQLMEAETHAKLL